MAQMSVHRSVSSYRIRAQPYPASISLRSGRRHAMRPTREMPVDGSEYIERVSSRWIALFADAGDQPPRTLRAKPSHLGEPKRRGRGRKPRESFSRRVWVSCRRSKHAHHRHVRSLDENPHNTVWTEAETGFRVWVRGNGWASVARHVPNSQPWASSGLRSGIPKSLIWYDRDIVAESGKPKLTISKYHSRPSTQQ